VVLDPSTRFGLAHGFDVAAQRELYITLYTSSHVVRGRSATRLRRLTDLLDQEDRDSIILVDAVIDGLPQSGAPAIRAPVAQVNFDAILFAFADPRPEPQPEFRLRKSPEDALVLIPPFTLAGKIHVLPERDVGEAIADLRGRFVPLTDAQFWSEVLAEPKLSAPFVAFNRDAGWTDPDPRSWHPGHRTDLAPERRRGAAMLRPTATFAPLAGCGQIVIGS
jgi:hypothetical protein